MYDNIRLGADVIDRTVDGHTGITSLPGDEGQQRRSAQVAVVVAVVRQRSRARTRTAVDDGVLVRGRERGQPVHDVRPGVGHCAGHGHVPDIQRHQRARGLRVHRVRGRLQVRRRRDDGRRVRRLAGPRGAVQRSTVRRGHRPVRPAAAAARLVRRLRRQPRGRRVRPVPRPPRAAGAGHAGRRHVLRQHRHHAAGHHHRVRVLPHQQPGAGQRHHATGHDHRVAGVAEDLPADRGRVRRAHELRAVRRRVRVQRGVCVPVHTGDQGQDVQGDRNHVQRKETVSER